MSCMRRRLFAQMVSVEGMDRAGAGAGTRSYQRNVGGIVNFHRLETTVACSGAIKPEGLPNIKKMGFVSVINLREPTEPGANVLEEGTAAKLRACDTTASPSMPIRLTPPRRTSFSTQSPRRALSRHSSIARAVDAPPRCGLSSVWPWIIGTLTAR